MGHSPRAAKGARSTVSTNLPVLAHDGHRFPRATEPVGSLTYEPFYGLKEKPFSLSSDPRFLFRSPSHAPAFDRLLAGIRRREGLIVLSGAIGTGKTTLCRAVLDRLDRRTFCTFVPDPFVSREDLLRMLLVDFGVMSIEDVKSGRLRHASRPELSYPLYEFLNSLAPLQAFAVLVIDEAQNLPPALLEEIRILSDLEGREKLLQVVLVGQPELKANLKLPDMCQVDQRVSVRCELSPLGRGDVAAYVEWRLNVAAGGTCSSVRFAPEAIDLIYEASGGTPRLINRICDGALYQAYCTTAAVVDAAAVKKSLADAGIEAPLRQAAVAAEAVLAPPPAAPGDRQPISRPSERPQVATVTTVRGLDDFASEKAAGFPSLRPAAMVASGALTLAAATLAATMWYRVGADQPHGVSLAAAPGKPTLRIGAPFAVAPPDETAPRAAAGAARYVIQVASFEDDARASQLVAQLTGRGYRAYQSSFDLDGEQWWQVAVGPYAAIAEPTAHLEKIRAIPGYEDAAIRSYTP